MDEQLVSIQSLRFSSYAISNMCRLFNLQRNTIVNGFKINEGYIRVSLPNDSGDIEYKYIHVLYQKQ